jgi:histone-lysine N-methyltransferase SETD1
MSGNCRAKTKPSKAILRIAPYNLPPFKTDANSVGPGEAEQIVVVGFDPFMMESTLRVNFGTFGKIASLTNKTDPATGSFLGIAQIKFRDHNQNGQEISAVTAAKSAEAAFKSGQKLQQQSVKVELDREGRRCKRHVEEALRKLRNEQDKRHGHAPSAPVTETPKPDASAPPPNAPKGPSASRAKVAPTIEVAPPTGPASTVAARSGPASLIEEEPILSKIKRKPYIHIPHSSVPVLGTTIPHLKKRLKAFDWREVRLDKTGYYVVFDDSKRGEDEAERCFAGCNNELLFTYHMAMECQKYGNPDYERSPSPERAMAEQQKQAQREMLLREDAEDFEIEKQNRAANLDPVLGALEQLRAELRDKIMSDAKARIAIPIFHEGLEPSKHAAKRRKLGLPDPSEMENKSRGLLFGSAGDMSPHKGRHGSHSKPLRPHDPNQQRGRKGERNKGPMNAFADERRRKPAPRPTHARGLHFRLQQMYEEEEEEDSDDDEQRTSITRDTEEQESRPLSRASRTSTPFDSESAAETPQNKRRKLNEWDEEDKEHFDKFQQDMLGHLLSKEPEDLATRELELVVNTLPRTSKYATRARTELFIRQRSKADDDLFDVALATKKDASKPGEAAATALDAKAAKEKVKKKRKTKKQILEEQEALKAEAEEAKAASESVPPEISIEIEEKEIELEAMEELEPEKDIDLRLTYDKPRRTVEEELTKPLDIDGWQDYLKDDEDMQFAKLALAEEAASDLGDVKLWAWRQKEIKQMNSVETPSGLQSDTLIQGYYVPNASGCARTEGYKKILNEEKSKYLPHRIKVQKAREERQALAKANPSAAIEAAKIAAAEKIVSKATSRSNRVNNRRLVNDINLQKQTLAASSNNSDADVAIRFNQLKKRKKLVKFDRSAIHGWGLYAEENIAINDLIIEYVGELVRQKVADMREIKYEKQGVGSSYLFRMLDDEIVDATKKGGIARFINHSCNPNCTAKIIKVEGTPRIVIYAMKDIGKSKFPPFPSFTGSCVLGCTTTRVPQILDVRSHADLSALLQTTNSPTTTNSSVNTAQPIVSLVSAAQRTARVS